MGTSTGTITAIVSLFAMGFGVGIYYNNNIRNIEILEIQKKNFIEIQAIQTQLQLIQIENKDLNLKLTSYEKNEKK
ncbi:hypothetical protein ACMDB5_09970 [Flavobacterium sp. W1B]|uniref:hypothetical protein n=1 Tax=Flavobacterium sp. W1B TaxID=3394146 RepID=UPI0039BCDCCC